MDKTLYEHRANAIMQYLCNCNLIYIDLDELDDVKDKPIFPMHWSANAEEQLGKFLQELEKWEKQHATSKR